MFISSSRTYGWRVSHGAYIRRVAFFFRSLIRDQSRRCSIGSMHVHDLLISPGFRPPNTLVFLRALISFVKVCSRFFGLLLFLYLFHREMDAMKLSAWYTICTVTRGSRRLSCFGLRTLYNVRYLSPIFTSLHTFSDFRFYISRILALAAILYSTRFPASLSTFLLPHFLVPFAARSFHCLLIFIIRVQFLHELQLLWESSVSV